jgi:hypothetical protein
MKKEYSKPRAFNETGWVEDEFGDGFDSRSYIRLGEAGYPKNDNKMTVDIYRDLLIDAIGLSHVGD